MLFLICVALVSFVAMAYMIGPSLVRIRREEVSHHEHVGLALVLAPLLRGVRMRALRLFEKIWPKVAPHFEKAFFVIGSRLHELSAKIAHIFLGLSARMKGRKTIRKNPSSPSLGQMLDGRDPTYHQK